MALNHFLDAAIAQAMTATANTMTAIAKISIAISNTMSDISSLEAKVTALNRGIAGWNRAYIWALGIALLVGAASVLIGAFSFWAQRQVISRSRELIDVSNRLSTEKDRQLQRDLKDKDLQITKAQTDLERERKERLELEKAISPRLLLIKDVSAIAALKIPGIRFNLFSANDTEALRATAQIRFVIDKAGWEMRATGQGQPSRDGVTIEAGKSADAQKAANVLLNLLSSNNWEEVRVIAPEPESVVPDNCVQINVGIKPILHFLPQETRDALRQLDETEDRSKLKQ